MKQLHSLWFLRKALPFLLLWIAFISFGVWVRLQIPASLYCGRDTEIYSFDFLGYAYTMTDFRYLGYGRFRHPLWGWLTAPVTLFGSKLIAMGEWPYWLFLLVVFAAAGVASLWLLWRLLHKLVGLSRLEALSAVCLYLSFAHVWLLAGMPETFGVSMMLALATLNWALGAAERRQAQSLTIANEVVSGPKIGQRVDLIGWILLAVLTGGVTITQLIKTALAYALTFRKWFETLAKVLLLALAVFALVVFAFYVRVQLRVMAYPNAPGMEAAWHSLFGHLMPYSSSFRDWAWQIWVFFSEPLVLRGENFDVRVITRGYDFWLQPILLAGLYGLVVVSAWINRKSLVVRLIGAMFLVDVGIHFVARWGLGESQLYGGHWMYGVPILVGMLIHRFEGMWHRILVVGVFSLAALILLCNIHGYFFHPVSVITPTANCQNRGGRNAAPAKAEGILSQNRMQRSK